MDMESKLFKKRHLPYYLIGSYLMIAPFLILPGTGMYDSKRILQLFLFVGLAFCFLFAAFRKNGLQSQSYLSGKMAVVGGLLFGAGIISSLFSEFTRYAFIEVGMTGIIFLSIMLLSEKTVTGHYRLGKFICGLTLLFASVYLIYFFGNYIAAHLNPLVPMWPDRIAVSVKIGDTIYNGKEVLNFAHKRFFNHLQTWTLPLIISMAIYFKSKSAYRNLIWVLLLCWWSLVFASGARGTLVAVFVACVVLFALFRKRSYRYLGVAAGTAIGGFLLYYLMFNMFVPSESLPVVRMTDSGRLDMWARAMELWLSNPLLGDGPMHYAVIEGGPYFAHPHNFYLQLLAEWGIVVLFCFLALPVFYFSFIQKKYLKDQFRFKELSTRNTAVYMGFAGSAVAGFAHAGVSGVFHTPISQIWAILIVAWLISLWNRKSDSNKIILIKRKYMTSVYLVILVSLLLLISYDLNEVNRNHAEYKKKFDQEKVYPRFWQQGLICEK